MNHCKEKGRRKNPIESASIFSLLTFAHTASTFKKANRKTIQEDDVYEVIDKCSSNRLGSELQRRWDKEQNKKKPKSVFKILWEMYCFKYFFLGLMILGLQMFKSLVQPSAYTNLVTYFNKGQTKLTKNDAYYYAAVVIGCNILGTIFYSYLYLNIMTISVEMRTGFTAFLYRKILKLSPAALSQISFGNIVTLMTTDVQIFENGIWVINDLWTGLIHSSMVCYLLYSRIGATTFAGIMVFFVVIPFQACLCKILKKVKLKSCKKTGERLEITQEALSMIRIIKMYTWENFFINKINKARKKEVNQMVASIYLRMALTLLGMLASKLGFYILIMAYIWMDNPPDSTIIFYIMSNYDDIKWFFGFWLPDGMGRVAEFMSALTRLNKVLQAEELADPKIESSENHQNHYSKPEVELKNITICIGEEILLKTVSFHLNSGLTLITGPVGSGKSTLLKVILQEFPLADGKVEVKGTISYSSQDPWLFASSLKQNILFGQKYNPKRYQEVLKVCALEYDLSLFGQGDETILSDKGLNLSKGQQARVNLARAIYRDSDIYLLDDCLTSLDNHVSDFIFEECIQTFLQGKFCVLVSQTERHLKKADSIVIMKEGEINKIVKPEELNEDILAILKKNVETDDKDKTIIEEEEISPTEKDRLLETEQIIERKKVFKEVLKEGSVPIQNYKKYLTYGGGLLIIFLYFVFSGIHQFADSYGDKLLTTWVDEQQEYLNIKTNITKYETNSSFTDIPKKESMMYLNLTHNLETAYGKQDQTFTWYYGMLFAEVFLNVIKTYIIFDFCRRASIKVHKDLIKKLINAVMLFFDTHYIGVILNRLSQDLVNVDENLSTLFNDCFGIIYQICGSLILIISVNYYFIFYVGIVTILMVLLGRMYIPFGRSMKRLEVSTRSPILGHLNSTFEGITTIRACKAETILIREFDRHHDLYTSSHFMLNVGQWAYGFFAECVSSFLVIFVVGTFIFTDTGSSAGSVGLALSQVFGIGLTIHWSISQYAELENTMTCAERLFEFTDIKTENQSGTVAKDWPKNGTINYDKVTLTYNKIDIILNKLSFAVSSKEKIGVVGRTGAGKSSIISTIFRLYDIEGEIQIDEIDIKTIALSYYRKNLAIIPQDPVLFSGTIRSNLDPLDQFKDEDLWKAIEKVNLIGLITKLDLEVTNRASNFSLGQKQMICVARAILAKAKIVILDEATANMDQESESFINDTIRSNFSECTILTIAHRVQTIMECDKVMVLDRGEIREFNNPKELLKNKDGYFYKMVQNTK